jgi:hypothetical protein
MRGVGGGCGVGVSSKVLNVVKAVSKDALVEVLRVVIHSGDSWIVPIANPPTVFKEFCN